MKRLGAAALPEVVESLVSVGTLDAGHLAGDHRGSLIPGDSYPLVTTAELRMHIGTSARRPVLPFHGVLDALGHVDLFPDRASPRASAKLPLACNIGLVIRLDPDDRRPRRAVVFYGRFDNAVVTAVRPSTSRGHERLPPGSHRLRSGYQFILKRARSSQSPGYTCTPLKEGPSVELRVKYFL